MITKAKVGLQAVKRFKQSVAAVVDHTSKFDGGMIFFEDFLCFLSEQIDAMRESIGNMEAAQKRLGGKIKEIEAETARMTAVLNNLEDQQSSLESELSSTPKSFTMPNESGKSCEVPNPAYTAIGIRLSAVKSEISEINIRLDSLQQRLNRATTIDGQLASQIDSSSSVIYSLQEKQSSSKQCREELQEVKNINLRNGKSAVDSLDRIEKIILSYLQIKMTHEAASLTEKNANLQWGGLNINISINKTVVNDNKSVLESMSKKQVLSKENIRKHKILFDDSGRIAEYDNKAFGGQYNTYEARLAKTSADNNPVLGYYEGERGESKYVPSGRTAEGVAVRDILQGFGLDGIEYRNAEPDFEVCAEAVVKIDAMSENRSDYYDSNGIPRLGNFTQADIECAKLWNNQSHNGRNDWTGRKIKDYRQANKLTWHEKCDTETMVLVRTEINSYFKHSGGCSECAVRDGAQVGGEFDE